MRTTAEINKGATTVDSGGWCGYFLIQNAHFEFIVLQIERILSLIKKYF